MKRISDFESLKVDEPDRQIFILNYGQLPPPAALRSPPSPFILIRRAYAVRDVSFFVPISFLPCVFVCLCLSKNDGG